MVHARRYSGDVGLAFTTTNTVCRCALRAGTDATESRSTVPAYPPQGLSLAWW